VGRAQEEQLRWWPSGLAWPPGGVALVAWAAGAGACLGQSKGFRPWEGSERRRTALGRVGAVSVPALRLTGRVDRGQRAAARMLRADAVRGRPAALHVGMHRPRNAAAYFWHGDERPVLSGARD
jgi:hypothetical protein